MTLPKIRAGSRCGGVVKPIIGIEPAAGGFQADGNLGFSGQNGWDGKGFRKGPARTGMNGCYLGAADPLGPHFSHQDIEVVSGGEIVGQDRHSAILDNPGD